MDIGGRYKLLLVVRLVWPNSTVSGGLGCSDLGALPIQVLLSLFLIQGIQRCHIHPLGPDEVLVIAKLEEVHVHVPEIWLSALILVIGYLVKDAQIRHDIFGLELLSDLTEQLSLLLGQLFVGDFHALADVEQLGCLI